MSPNSSSTTSTEWYSVRQLKIFQFVFGVYLAIHFGSLVPYAEELFGRSGMIADPQSNPTYGYLPNMLHWIDHSPQLVGIFLVALSCLSVTFAFRLVAPRLIAVVLWYGWACLLNRNVLILNPGIPFIGFLLLAFGLIDFASSRREDSEYEETVLNPQVFPWLYWGGWTVYAIGYTISGLHKLQSPSWIDGSALSHVLRSPLSRDNALCRSLLSMDPIILQVFTWTTLAAEIAFFPLGLFYHTRKLFWLIFLAFNIGVLLLINFTDLTCGILMMHFFLFDSRWFFPTNA